ncbi:MAG: molybdenum cofactor guanylyltransferase [Acidimicrobiia bacterium]
MPETPASILGCVLAGGRGSRMGGDKALVEVGDATMLERVAGVMAAVTDRVVVLGSDREGWDCWPDATVARGPLAGIVTALTRMVESRALVVAVDQPFVRSSTLHHLSEVASELPVVPVDARGIRQVTCAVYPANIAAEAGEEAVAGGSIQSLLDRVSFTPVTPETWQSWGEDGRSWYSIDTQADLVEGLARFGAG